jgi:hypothetical protein
MIPRPPGSLCLKVTVERDRPGWLTLALNRKKPVFVVWPGRRCRTRTVPKPEGALA